MKIFVFGSNLAGRHGKGAALFARKFRGASYGQGIGIQGHSYAIPTKDYKLKVLSLDYIKHHIILFLEFARRNRHLEFEITRIGCGLSGYDWETEIRPLFPAQLPPNCEFIEPPSH